MSEIDWKKASEVRMGTNVRTVLVDTRGAGTTGQDSTAEFAGGSEVVQPLGLIAHPLVNSSLGVLVLRSGDDDVILAFVDKGASGGPDVEAGEVRLESLADKATCIRIRANGDIEIIPKAGQKVYVGGGAGAAGMEPLALGQTLANFLTSFRTWSATHTHTESGTTTSPPVAPPPAVPSPIATSNVQGV